ncbi:putative cytoplasmic protein [Salmonella sp. NCTC 11881]|nr:putative cytoplasmic protein [Salmonella sp. NCTC 11881]
METLSVIHTVANRLRELNPDMDIHISSTDAKVYIPTGQQVTVLIHYCGSVFAEPENTDATVQKQLIRISATVIVPQISDAINALDRLRRSLGGIELPDCDRPLWLESEKIYRRRRKLLPLRPGYDRQHPVYRGTGKQGLPPADNR